jgi:branched-chain amino acid transport system permease protein
MNSKLQNLIVPLVLLLGAIALPMLAPIYYVQLASKMLLMGMLAMALNLVVGFGGLVSLCHAAFFGLAGYVLALLSPEGKAASVWFSLPVTMAVCGLTAAIIGALSLRTKGIYFIMVTLAFGEMLFYLFHDTNIGGGSDGMYIYFKPDVMLGSMQLFDLDKPRTFYFVALGCVLLTIWLLRTLVNAPFGHALAAARDNARRAVSLGFPVFTVRLVAFVISGILAGIAGYFSAAQFGFVAPQLLGWHLSATVLVMVVLGGMRSITGPLIGAAVIIGLEEVLKSSTEHWKLIYGLTVIFIVFALPGGVQQLSSLILGRKTDAPQPGTEVWKGARNAQPEITNV